MIAPMKSKRSEAGFSLIEVLVAAIVGLGMVTAAGLLGLNIFHHRASYDSISAATSLAEREFEILRDLQNPVSSLVSGTASGLNPNGTSGGQFNVAWTVTDPFPTALQGNCAAGVSGVKKVSIRVTHTNNPAVDVNLVTYYKVC